MNIKRVVKMILWGCALILMVCVFAIAGWLFQEDEYRRIKSPDGKYVAIASYRRLESWKPRMPGQGGDKAGFITIEDSSGVSYGKYQVAMVSMVRDVRWTDGGAYLPGYCEWDFVAMKMQYWNESQTKQTTIKMD